MSRAAAMLGERIRQARRAAGLSQRALERQCDLAHPRILELERGKYDPRTSKLFRIAEVLGICPGTLMRCGQPPAREIGLCPDD